MCTAWAGERREGEFWRQEDLIVFALWPLQNIWLLFKVLFLFWSLKCSYEPEFHMLVACWSNFSFGLPKIKICCLCFKMSNGFITLAANRAGEKIIEMLKTSEDRWLYLSRSNRFCTKQQPWSNAAPIDPAWVWLSASLVNLALYKVLLNRSCDCSLCGTFAGKMHYCLVWG